MHVLLRAISCTTCLLVPHAVNFLSLRMAVRPTRERRMGASLGLKEAVLRVTLAENQSTCGQAATSP